MDDDLNELIDRVGELFNGYDLASVLTALTYLTADACIQSETSEDVFLQRFIMSFANAIDQLKEENNGNSTHH